MATKFRSEFSSEERAQVCALRFSSLVCVGRVHQAIILGWVATLEDCLVFASPIRFSVQVLPWWE